MYLDRYMCSIMNIQGQSMDDPQRKEYKYENQQNLSQTS